MEEVRSIEPGASDLVGTRSRANLGRTFDGNIRSTASDRIRVPARPAQHVHISVPDMRRRTRRSASTTVGGARHMTIGRAEADQAGARPSTVAREPVETCDAIPLQGNRAFFAAEKDDASRTRTTTSPSFRIWHLTLSIAETEYMIGKGSILLLMYKPHPA